VLTANCKNYYLGILGHMVHRVNLRNNFLQFEQKTMTLQAKTQLSLCIRWGHPGTWRFTSIHA